MSDPLDYMNKFCSWKVLPKDPYDRIWLKTVSAACDAISRRDIRIEKLEKRIKILNQEIRILEKRYKDLWNREQS